MSRPRPRYLQKQITRHGRIVWYVRKGRGRYIRLRAPYGTPEFWAEYEAASRGDAASERRRASKGTLRWAIDLYMQSAVWQSLAASSRRNKQYVLARLVAKAGDAPIADITRAHIVDGREARASKPSSARDFLVVIRGVLRWCVDCGIIEKDPSAGIRAKRPKSDSSRHGMPTMSSASAPNGRPAPASASRLISCFIRVCAAAMPCGSVGNMSRMAWRG
jgi:hypothetical protein